MPIINTVVTGAVGAAIANFFQRRQFNFREREQRLVELRQQREEFVTDLMKRDSQRVFTLIKAIQVMTDQTLSDDEIIRRREAYEKAVEDTAVNYSQDLLYLRNLFGQDISNMYSQKIMEGPFGFVDLGNTFRLIHDKYFHTKRLIETGVQTPDENLAETTAAGDTEVRPVTAPEEFLSILSVKAADLVNQVRQFGFSPLGKPFYHIITTKEDFIEID